MAKATEGARGTTGGRRAFAPKAVVLILTLSVAAGVVYLVADWLRDIILEKSPAAGGEWAALLGGGFATWAFFLVRSGLIQQTLGLWPTAKAVFTSLRAPGWPPFISSLGDLTRTVALPGIVTVFALVFVGEGVGEQITRIMEPKPPPVGPEPPDIPTQIGEIGDMLDSLEKRIEDEFRKVDLPAALNGHGYTPRRAGLLDQLEGLGGYRSNYYFARFAVSFDRADLNPARDGLAAGVDAASVRNPELIDEVARALLPCGSATGDNPVVLKVEGYASSEPFGTDVDSDMWNVRTANARRHTVAQMLRESIRAENGERVVVCESADYEWLEDMEREREFNDRLGGDRLADQYLLTRAAHIKVLHPGLCKVGEERGRDEGPTLTKGASECLEKERLRLGRG